MIVCQLASKYYLSWVHHVELARLLEAADDSVIRPHEYGTVVRGNIRIGPCISIRFQEFVPSYPSIDVIHGL
jgi:hypothetical protein